MLGITEYTSIVEMDYETNNPRIRLLNPFGVYPELDRFGRTISLVQVVSTDAETLAAQYPEYATQIMPQNRWQQGSPAVSLVRYHDKDQDLIFLPERQNLILANVPNPVGKCLANVAIRSSLDGEGDPHSHGLSLTVTLEHRLAGVVVTHGRPRPFGVNLTERPGHPHMGQVAQLHTRLGQRVDQVLGWLPPRTEKRSEGFHALFLCHSFSPMILNI